MNQRVVYLSAALIVGMFSIPLLTSAQNSFLQYSDVEQVLAHLADLLPPQLNTSDLSARRNSWPEWVITHDRDIRQRLLRGDEDTIANWLLFGTSFTPQPRALFEVTATSDAFPRVISGRITDFVAAVASRDSNERSAFARQVLLSQGYRFDTTQERSRLERHLRAEVDRIIGERQEYRTREDGFPAGDVIGQIMVGSTMFRDRGLSLDTSILASFAVEQALETMKNQQLLLPNRIRRVAVIGPGLDFADKNSGYDFYPVQTMQPFTTIDSLVRLGLAAAPTEIEVTTFDVSPRVNDHIQAIRGRAKTGMPYVLRVATDLGSQWTPAFVGYWKNIGDRIGSAATLPRPTGLAKGIELRGIEVRPEVAERVSAVDFNVVTEKWTGPPFDLVIATNVLVYYDKLDQSLAFAGVEGMLRPGGFFVTNNVIVELPASRLRSVGIMTVRHAAATIDHVFWYRRL